MAGLSFSSEAAFAVAIASGTVPDDVLRRPVRFARQAVRRSSRGARVDRVIVDTGSLETQTVDALVALGAVRASLPKELEIAPFWPAIVRPERTSDAHGGSVLFRVGSPHNGLELATSLLGLGASRVEIATFQDELGPAALVHAAAPSHYLVSKAMDRLEGLAVFVRVSADRDDVWIEAGYSQKSLRGLRPRGGEIILGYGDGTIEQPRPSRFTNALESLDLELLPATTSAAPVELPRHTVRLRLVRGVKTRPASLWVLREDAIVALDRLVESADERLLGSMTFLALGAPDAPMVVLRALSGVAPPSFFEGEAYAPLAELGDVYAPADMVLHPPAGTQRLRAAVGGPDDRMRWLAKKTDGVTVESAPIAAFRPLLDWVELTASHADMTPWLRNVSFDPVAFEAVERADDEPRSRRTGAGSSASGSDKKRRIAAVEETPVEDAPVAKPAATRGPAPPARVAEPALLNVAEPSAVSTHEARLVQAERNFFSEDVPLAAHERDASWLVLASLYDAANHPIDARMCWARVALGGGEQAAAAKRTYLEAALRWRGVDRARAWSTALLTAPGAEPTELLPALLVAHDAGAPPMARSDHDKVVAALDAADPHLDVRTSWLARLALATLSGGDALLLARARDRVIARLQRGLSLGRDLPRVVRSLEVGGASERVRALVDTLAYFETTARPKGPLEADPRTTLAYVRLVYACALARTGDAPRARNLLEVGASALPKNDPIHTLLAASFTTRVHQALEAEPELVPLPPEIATAYEALGRLDRYKIDRVRQASKLLEPDPDLDPFRSFGLVDASSAADIVTRVANAARPSDSAATLDEVLASCDAEADAAQRRRRLGTATTAMLYAPLAIAAPRLDRVIGIARSFDGTDRLRTLAGLLPLAARLERPDAARAIVGHLSTELEASAPQALASSAAHIARGAASLRKGDPLQPELESMVNTLLSRISAGDAPSRIARLVLTRTLADAGAPNNAREELAADLRFLEVGTISPADRLQLARSLASCAVAIGSFEVVREVASLWKRMTDSYNTNTHLCLSAVELADAVAWSLAPRRGDASSLARQLADEDEHAVRAAVFRR